MPNTTLSTLVLKYSKGMTSEILLYNDLIDMKARNKPPYQYFDNALVCPYLFTNSTSFKLRSLLSLFYFILFLNSGFQIGGALYMWVQVIHGLSWLLCFPSLSSSLSSSSSSSSSSTYSLCFFSFHYINILTMSHAPISLKSTNNQNIVVTYLDLFPLHSMVD